MASQSLHFEVVQINGMRYIPIPSDAHLEIIVKMIDNLMKARVRMRERSEGQYTRGNYKPDVTINTQPRPVILSPKPLILSVIPGIASSHI